MNTPLVNSSAPSDTSFENSPLRIRVVSRRDFLQVGAAATAGVCLAGSPALAQTPPAATQAVPLGGKPPLVVTEQDREYMREAIRLMRQAGVVDKTGGPFGAVIVRDGKVLAARGNSVVKDHDPSAHAEVNAIREACRKLGVVDLKGAVLYSSCECCPMCYATAFWARIDKIFYAAGWDDYADIFDDVKLSQDLAKIYPQRLLAPQQIMQDDARKVWQEFRQMPDGARY